MTRRQLVWRWVRRRAWPALKSIGTLTNFGVSLASVLVGLILLKWIPSPTAAQLAIATQRAMAITRMLLLILAGVMTTVGAGFVGAGAYRWRISRAGAILQDFELEEARYTFRFEPVVPLRMDYFVELRVRALQDGLESFSDAMQWSGTPIGEEDFKLEVTSGHTMLEQHDEEMWRRFTVGFNKKLKRGASETITLHARLTDTGETFEPFTAKCLDRLAGLLILRAEFPEALWPSQCDVKFYPYFTALHPKQSRQYGTQGVVSESALNLPGEKILIRPHERWIEWQVPNPLAKKRYALTWDWSLDAVRGNRGAAASVRSA